MAKGRWPSALGFQSQSQLVDSLVEVVVRHAPEGWTWAHLEANMVASSFTGSVAVTAGDRQFKGPIREGRALGLLRQLRHRMYVPGSGTWWSMTLDVAPGAEPTTTFDYDAEPSFDIDPGAKEYVRDLSRFGRKEAHRPDWLKAKVDEAGQTGDSAWDTFSRWVNGD